MQLNANLILSAYRIVVGTFSGCRWKLGANVASMTERFALVIRAKHFISSTGRPFIFARFVRSHAAISVTVGAAFGFLCRTISLVSSVKLAMPLLRTKESTGTRRYFITFQATF